VLHLPHFSRDNRIVAACRCKRVTKSFNELIVAQEGGEGEEDRRVVSFEGIEKDNAG
jgi:hypothetical protein